MSPQEKALELLTFHQSTQGLDSSQIRRIAAHSEVVHFDACERVHTAGSEVESLWLIVVGEMEISVCLSCGTEQAIQYIGRDDHFGFLSIHGSEPLPVSVTAKQDSIAIRIPKSDAVPLLQELPLWRRSIMRSLGPRLRQAIMDQKQKKRLRFVAIIHAAENSRELTVALARRLADTKESVSLISDDATVCRTAPGRSENLLDELGVVRPRGDLRTAVMGCSNSGRFILDASMRHGPGELASLLTSADAVYCVGGGDSDAAMISFLKSVIAKSPSIRDRLHVVRVLDPRQRVAARVAELDRLCPRDFKVAANEISGDPADRRRPGVERIVHHLRGVSVGLALGGGAARGMAHLGVLNVLENEGIAIDQMSGTSAGALTGIGYAAGFTPDYLIDAFASDLKPPWWYRLLPYGDALYMLAKYRRRRWEEMVRKHYRDWHLQQLPIPFTTVAADLISASEVRRNSGDATSALLESINLPIMSRPICRDGMALVDGGVLNVVPANVLVEQDANLVIAVDVTANIRYEFRGNRPDTPTAKMKVPSSAHTAIRVRTIQNRNIRSLGTGAADLIIEPDVSKVEMSDFQHADHIAAIGQAAAEEALPRLRQILHQLDADLFPVASTDRAVLAA